MKEMMTRATNAAAMRKERQTNAFNRSTFMNKKERTRSTMTGGRATFRSTGVNDSGKEFDYLSCRKRDHKYYFVLTSVLKN